MAATQTNPVEASLGYEQLASLATAHALAAKPTDASGDPKPAIAYCQCDPIAAIAVRYRDDGTAPTASVGMVLMPGEVLKTGASLANLKFIEVSTGAKVNVTYYPYPEAF